MLNFIDSERRGICSVCSANSFVLRAVFRNAKAGGDKVLIESTSNQVDQHGGYTGMTPQKFVEYVRELAESTNFSYDNIILGGDHLGPNAWQNEPADSAMKKAKDLIAAYVQAGYKKIHLDTSMRCADDPAGENAVLDVRTVAERAALLCQVAEQNVADGDPPLYIIGTDVPIPGGAKGHLEDIRITPVREVEETIEISKKVFYEQGLARAWERVIAVVVQPGVEFGDDRVVNYEKEKAAALVKFIHNRDDLVYEAHSTDYQSKQALRQMVQDKFAILKVGPWLTFALRETFFALAMIEEELSGSKNSETSGLIATIDERMLAHPQYWRAHYHGDPDALKLARKYSYSDRLRYYWPDKVIAERLEKMLKNLGSREIPVTLISQFLPIQYEAIMDDRISSKPDDLIYFGVARVLDKYAYAVGNMN
jgi:D-tagatose-1,6-bisphosphate aldolase subunit GatZ/KbaZ